MEPTRQPTEPTTSSDRAAARMAARPWYLKPRTAIWLSPVLIVACLALRFGWGGIEGPPLPFWLIAYVLGAAGIFLTYLGVTERKQG